MFYKDVKHLKVGLRINPGMLSHFDLADPARKHSRLGVVDIKKFMLSLIRSTELCSIIIVKMTILRF